MHIANVTATKDGETLENAADVKETDLAALLDYADEIIVHEVHDEEWVADRKSRFPDEWDEKVTVLAADGDESNEDVEDREVCRHADCDDTATQKAVCEQGQEKHYCDDHAGGQRAGHACVKEWVVL